ncbi:MAG: hypothetical protein QOF58_5510 [Pseudonocardiales bacterium]|nr:hypothetical protein [Pseudonocardiales bacterium]
MNSSVFDDITTRGRQQFSPPVGTTSAHLESRNIRIAGNDRARIVLESIAYWPNGFTLNLATFLRAPAQRIPLLLHHPLEQPPAPDGPCLAVRFADGRRATTLDPLEYERDVTNAVVLNLGSGAGGSETFMREGIYVEPLPPPGAVTVTARWHALGVDEGSIELDGTAIRAGAGRALSVWS